MTRKAKTTDAQETAPAAEAPREKTTRAAAVTAEAAPKERQPDFIWSGQPVYRCRLCGDRYERVSDLASVEDHERTQHPTNIRATGLLDANGRPVIVRTN